MNLSQSMGFRFRVSGFRPALAFSLLTPETLYETSFPKLELVQSRGTLHFVGWVEPTPDFVGFRCTQLNLHFAGSNAQCETQQQQILEPSSKSFDLTGRFFGRRLG